TLGARSCRAHRNGQSPGESCCRETSAREEDSTGRGQRRRAGEPPEPLVTGPRGLRRHCSTCTAPGGTVPVCTLKAGTQKLGSLDGKIGCQSNKDVTRVLRYSAAAESPRECGGRRPTA